MIIGQKQKWDRQVKENKLLLSFALIYISEQILLIASSAAAVAKVDDVERKETASNDINVEGGTE